MVVYTFFFPDHLRVREMRMHEKATQEGSFLDRYPADIWGSCRRTSTARNFGQARKALERQTFGCRHPRPDRGWKKLRSETYACFFIPQMGIFGRWCSCNGRIVLQHDVAVASEVLSSSKISLAITVLFAKQVYKVGGGGGY